MYGAHFVHLLVDGCLGSFRLLAVGNSASVTINTSSSPCFQFFGYPHLKIKSQNYFFQNLFLKAHCQLDAIIRQLLSCVRLCDPMDCSTPGFPVLCCLLEFAQTHVHWVGKSIQPSHPLSPPSLPALNLYQHQGLFQRISSLHQVAKVLELWFQHQSFHWIFGVDFL